MSRVRVSFLPTPALALLLLGACALPPDQHTEEIPPVIKIVRKIEAERKAMPSPAPAPTPTPTPAVQPSPPPSLATALFPARPVVEPPLPIRPANPASLPMLPLVEPPPSLAGKMGEPVMGEVLLRVEIKIPQAEADNLLEEAQYSYEAQQLLADLWKQHRLPDATTMALVDRYLLLKLVEEPRDKASPKSLPALRELRIVPHTDFPFPSTFSIDFDYDIAVGGEAKIEEGPQRTWTGLPAWDQLNGTFVGSFDGSYPGTPVAVALCKLRLIDRSTSHQRILWAMTKTLPPLALEPRG